MHYWFSALAFFFIDDLVQLDSTKDFQNCAGESVTLKMRMKKSCAFAVQKLIELAIWCSICKERDLQIFLGKAFPFTSLNFHFQNFV